VKEGSVRVRQSLVIFDDRNIRNRYSRITLNKIEKIMGEDVVVLNANQQTLIEKDTNLDEKITENADRIEEFVQETVSEDVRESGEFEDNDSNRELDKKIENILIDELEIMHKMIADTKPGIEEISSGTGMVAFAELDELHRMKDIAEKKGTLNISVKTKKTRLKLNGKIIRNDSISVSYQDNTVCLIEATAFGYEDFKKEVLIKGDETYSIIIDLEEIPKNKDESLTSENTSENDNDEVKVKEEFIVNIDSIIEMSPVINNGKIYFNTGSGHVYSVDLKGKILWKYSLPKMTESFLNVSGNRVYISCNDDNFYANNAETGKLEWKKDVGSMFFSNPV
ncbi:MAG: PQQ-binding-like beta-propeller repeat protein, partial [Actinomycetia bacterium]|nr:PQQ-binding-like beta-propeller repeat protein [Actinomycetes bacterium]